MMNWVKGSEIDLDAVTKCVHRKKACSILWSQFLLVSPCLCPVGASNDLRIILPPSEDGAAEWTHLSNSFSSWEPKSDRIILFSHVIWALRNSQLLAWPTGFSWGQILLGRLFEKQFCFPSPCGRRRCLSSAFSVRTWLGFPQIKLTESGFPLLSLDHLSQHRASKTSPTWSGHPDLVLPSSQWQKANQCSTLCQHVFRVLSLILFCLATFWGKFYYPYSGIWK